MSKITQKNYEAIKIYRLKEKIFTLKGEIQSLKEENEKLKELLCKAKGVIAAYRLSGSISFYSNEDEECVIQIEQALGLR